MQRRHRLLMAGLVAVALAVALVAGISVLENRLVFGVQPSLAAEALVYYVDADAIGEDNGSTWQDAFTDLQEALALASPGYEIWVAEGIYKPTSGIDRAISFQLQEGVAVYGGFDPSGGADRVRGSRLDEPGDRS